jgi:hypothetical protein
MKQWQKDALKVIREARLHATGIRTTAYTWIAAGRLKQW